ncbi:hypothetical protein BGZ58_000726 [Dissophora ornata]|nr:hypothetical protein BGZ58_000726 [Dissophora ornata]
MLISINLLFIYRCFMALLTLSCIVLLTVLFTHPIRSFLSLYDWANITMNIALFMCYVYALKVEKQVLKPSHRALVMFFFSIFLFGIGLKQIVKELQYVQDYSSARGYVPGAVAWDCSSSNNPSYPDYVTSCVLGFAVMFTATATGVLAIFEVVLTLIDARKRRKLSGETSSTKVYGRHGYGDKANVVVQQQQQQPGLVAPQPYYYPQPQQQQQPYSSPSPGPSTTVGHKIETAGNLLDLI